MRTIDSLSARLGNTPAICRKCYIHPAILDTYLDGPMLQTLKQRTEQEIAFSLHNLQPEEAATMALLQQYLAKEAG